MDKIKTVFSILNYNIDSDEDLFNIKIEADRLKDTNLINKFYKSIPDFKKDYKSNSLTCLHKNSLNKQKFPAVNFIRQILKCNNYKFQGFYIPCGYNKQTGKKILKRYYKIVKLEHNNEYVDTVNQNNKEIKPIFINSIKIKL